MRIEISNSSDNWLRWGQLVKDWIDGTVARPATIKELRKLLADRTVAATVQGADDRRVAILTYEDKIEQPLTLYLPSDVMTAAMAQRLTPGPYPLPVFYDLAYVKAERANVSPQLMQEFKLRRIGEYVANECC